MRSALAKTYLVLALTCGAIMATLSPPFQAPDEPNHFYRAQALSEGRLWATRNRDLVGAPMSAAIPEWVFAVFDGIAGHPEKRLSLEVLRAHRDRRRDDPRVVFVDFRNSALYSPVAYVPQAVGLGLGRLLNLPMLDSYYLARLLSLLSGVALCYWASLRLPYGQLTFVLIALCPMFLFEQASLSADGPAYALAAAFGAAVLQKSHGPGDAPLTGREVAGLSVLGALTVLTKPSSAPLPLLALVLLRRATGAPVRPPWREVVIIVGVSWAAMLAWSVTASGLYVVANPASGIDPAGQWSGVKGHPIRFAAILWSTLQAQFYPIYLSAVGVLGWLDTILAPRYIRYFYWALLLSGLSADPRRGHASWPAHGLALLLVISTYVLIGVISYLTWTPVGAPRIEGFQGRYFLPLIVPWAVLLQWPARLQERLGPRLRLALTTACLAYAMFFLGHAFTTLVGRYWL